MIQKLKEELVLDAGSEGDSVQGFEAGKVQRNLKVSSKSYLTKIFHFNPNAE